MEDVSLHSVVQSLIDVAPGIEAANQQGRLRQGRPWREASVPRPCSRYDGAVMPEEV